MGWGAIWGGLLTAIGLFLLLSFLLTAIGVGTVQAVDPGARCVRARPVFGAAGALLDIYREVGFNIQEAAAEIDRQVLLENVQLAAWIAFFGLLLSALAATLGGWVGAGVRGPSAAAR